MKILKPQIVLTPSTETSLERVRRARDQGAPTRKRSVSDMLSQLYGIAGEMLDELECAELPLAVRLVMAEKAARLLPVLDKAERRSRAGKGGKAPEDMTDQELRRAIKAATGSRRRQA